MAEPKLELEKRLDRIELAIRTLAFQLVEAQTGFGERDAQGIAWILEGPNEVERPNLGEVADRAPEDG
jgi:hypothetical protein